jgi:NAD(P)-dependent dehydrogenase (short-subunit alcohol dehydrogenase family)
MTTPSQPLEKGFQLRYDNRVTLITGGGSGMGREHAILLASRGAKVVIVTDASSSGEGEVVVREILTVGGEAEALSTRIGNDQDAIEVIKKAIDH